MRLLPWTPQPLQEAFSVTKETRRLKAQVPSDRGLAGRFAPVLRRRYSADFIAASGYGGRAGRRGARDRGPARRGRSLRGPTPPARAPPKYPTGFAIHPAPGWRRRRILPPYP